MGLRAIPLLLGLLTGALVAVVPPGASGRAASSSVKVWFLQGEQMVAVSRPGTNRAAAVRQLLAGPTAAETKRGIRTYVPAETPVRSVSVADGVVTVDLGLKFIHGRDAQSLLARLSQVVYTAAGGAPAQKVRLRIEGGTPLGVFPGVVTALPLTVKYLQTPNVPAPGKPQVSAPPATSSVRQAQSRLVALGFLLQSEVDGRDGPATQSAVIAFQKWEGLGRDGKLGPQTLSRLATAKHPAPFTRGGSGRRAEVLLDRQVALAIENNRVVRVVHVSTGKSSTPTPTGTYTVYSKISKWWSVPFREWLLWAVPFNAGIAFHEFTEVPVYAASHGCVRNTYSTAHWMYDFSRVGMPVKVIARSR